MKTATRPFALRLVALAGMFSIMACADSQEVSAPEVEVTQSVTYVTIAAGNFFSCALTDIGDVYCWGSSISSVINGSRPTRIESDQDFSSITAGASHACGLTASGQAFCWGSGLFGNGTVESSETPVPAAGSLRFVSIDAGAFHTCGVAADGAPYCWGRSADGQLGDGSDRSTTSFKDTPVRVSGSVAFRQISAGGSHTCGVSLQSTAYCWGEGGHGEIGDGAGENRLVPSHVAGLEEVESIVVSQINDFGDGFTCAVSAGGLVTSCWGQNRWGQTGQIPLELQSGCHPPCNAPVLVPEAVLGGPSFREVALGSEHSCGLTNQGRAWCWGLPSLLGDGVVRQFRPQHEPVQVAGDHTFISIAAGELHSCAITTDGDAFCWGSGSASGTGAAARFSRIPVRVWDPLAG